MVRVKVVYKDGDFLVIDKPAGLLVHPVAGKKERALVDWLTENYPEVKNVGDDPKIRPGIVHRLDKDTSGLMIVALSQRAFDYFKKQFQERKIKKTYQAVVWGVPKESEGVIEKPIGLKPDTIKRTVHINKAKMVKEAVTRYRVLEERQNDVIASRSEAISLLEVQPLTGRTHQIRVHLASIGHPIVGDKLYGSKKQSDDKLLLRAVALEFSDLNGKRLKIEGDGLAKII